MQPHTLQLDGCNVWAPGLLYESFERLLAAAALLALSPVLVAIAVAVRSDSPGPAVFRQNRIGLNGVPFTLYKFRGMYVNSRTRYPELYSYSLTDQEADELVFHRVDDPRITRVGRFIRRANLDELPNLINVVLGDMNFVGPRPQIPELVRYYSDRDFVLLRVKPGITSISKTRTRESLTMRQELDMEVEYLKRRTPLSCLLVVVDTLWNILRGRNPGA